MISFYGIDYTSQDGSRETLTIYAYGDDQGAGIAYIGSDPSMPNANGDAVSRHLSTADTQVIADAYAQRITDLLVALIPGATIHVRQGDDIPV